MGYSIIFNEIWKPISYDAYYHQKTAIMIAKWTVEIVIEKLAVSNTKLGDKAADDITSNP